MSVWTTKSLNKNQEFVVIKHKLRDINGMINGVKFRAGYAVVEKDSKTYKNLKKLPMLKNAPEYPLTHLRKLLFITRTYDVKLIYGQDVYHKYLEVLKTELNQEKEEKETKAEEEHIEDIKRCNHRTVNGNLCKRPALEVSPAGYCKMHLLEDEEAIKLSKLEIPTRLTRGQKKEYKNKIIERLSK